MSACNTIYVVFYVTYSISALETAGLTSKKVDPQDEDEAPGAGASPSGWWNVGTM